ncbi:hypothetical protein QN277_023023 [Acacia crassicarpa]|uniref:Transposase-associated domain-containing protein n=1 Tax=Acacia crassicarpa TaxID=499986 RepID=A0AAE1KAR1_9FABA|nr:hypothetical protein QN277_023023 [Acacia crassicarpa]
MEVTEHQRWMYNRINPSTKWVTVEFEQGVDGFLTYVYQSPYSQKWGELRCPCVKCKSRYYLPFDEVKVHLYSKGFMPDYYVWTSHGERRVENHPSMSPIAGDLHASHGAPGNHLSQYEMMVMDAAGPSFRDNYNEGVHKMPNTNAREFDDMLRAAQQPLWEGCEESQLSTTL